jgi:aldehyde:ferredoxin oxidoreductase
MIKPETYNRADNPDIREPRNHMTTTANQTTTERAYNGRILNIRLSERAAEPESLPDELYRQYLGGYGLGARLLFDRIPQGADALGPDNVLGFFPGLLTGTPLFGIRFQVVAKSPKNNGWGDANCGGDFGPYLKHAGWDGLLFYGASPTPVYVLIEDDKVEIRDAADLWGMLAIDVEHLLKERHGKKASVACIGPAGETLSPMAGVCNDHGRLAARSGLGAVMGSKRVKAVVVTTTRSIIAGEKPVFGAVKEALADFRAPIANFFRTYGTTGITAMSAFSGDSPVRNWGGVGAVDFPEGKDLTGDLFNERMKKKYGCWHCPLACGAESLAPIDPKYPYPENTHRPEYETAAAFGSMTLNHDPESLIYVNHLCNQYGFDVISAGATIAFAIECFENGIITKEDTDGLELRWGNTDAVVALLDKMGHREGIGELFADGVARAAEKLGPRAAPFAITIAGEELPMHDPKLNPEYYTTYKLDPTPPRHTQYDGGARAGWNTPPRTREREAQEGRGEHHKAAGDYIHVVNSTGMCMFIMAAAPNDKIPHWINLTTGWDTTPEEILKAGERIANLRLAFTAREGDIVTKRAVPQRVFDGTVYKEGPHAGFVLETETLEREFLEAADWDAETGKPRRRKLESLGLKDVADKINAP